LVQIDELLFDAGFGVQTCPLVLRLGLRQRVLLLVDLLEEVFIDAAFFAEHLFELDELHSPVLLNQKAGQLEKPF